MSFYLYKYAATVFTVFVIKVHVASGQMSITGPDCILPGIEYQYVLSGNSSSPGTIKWCVTGGVITDSDSTCNSGAQNYIRVKWNNNAQSISVQTGAQNNTKQIKATQPLTPGRVEAVGRFKEKKKNQTLTPISCSQPSGGSCTPHYIFQWEESIDGMKWNVVPGATEAQLKFSSDLKQTMYYRRKVRETVSNSEAVTDAAIVMVKKEKK